MVYFWIIQCIRKGLLSECDYSNLYQNKKYRQTEKKKKKTCTTVI